MDNFLNNVKAHLYERVTNPLFSTFMFSWVVWNHKIFIVFFSSESLVSKFGFIKYNIYQTVGDTMLYGLIYPLVTTIVYLFVLPKPIRYVYEKWATDQQKLLDIKNEVERNKLLTVEKSQELRMELYTIKDKAISEKEELLKEIETYKSVIEKYKVNDKYQDETIEIDNNRIEALEKENQKLKNLVNKKSIPKSIPSDNQNLNIDDKILLLADRESEINSSMITKKLGINSNVAKRKINKFIQDAILSKIHNTKSDTDTYYYLTILGKNEVEKIKKRLSHSPDILSIDEIDAILDAIDDDNE